MIDRRHLLASLGAAAATGLVLPRSPRGQPLGTDSFVEEQRGDPSLPYESVVIEPDKIDRLVIPPPAGPNAFDDWRKEFPGQFVAVAKKLVGCSRARTPGVIADFLDLFDLPFKTGAGRFVPYAAAAVSFVGAMAYCDLINRSYNDGNHRAVFRLVLPDLDHWYFTPTPSCWDSFRLAAGRRRWAENPHRETAPALFPHPGWIAVYNFGKGADHCGIVET